MTLVRVANPETETDVVLIASALQAADIPYFVHGGAIGGALPGVQIASLNTKTVMVPESCVDFAMEVIDSLHLSDSAPGVEPTSGGKLRVGLETLLFCWFVPSHRRPIDEAN